MTKGRLEAFSDGVIAIIITIMVLELKAPHTPDLGALLHVLPNLLAYLLSFVLVGVYWNNHHHLFHVCQGVTGSVMWANLHLLFWLSLVPFVTDWMAETFPQPVPVAAYGGVLLFAGFAYFLLVRALLRSHGPSSALARAIGRDVKGKVSVLLYVLAIGLAFVNAWIACAFYVAVLVVWLIPDRRIERVRHE
ncbi:MAG TPA: TMEM175 family protein [bacterium]